MSATSGWITAVLAILGLVLVLHQLGVDVSITLGEMLRGTERILGQPIFLP